MKIFIGFGATGATSGICLGTCHSVVGLNWSGFELTTLEREADIVILLEDHGKIKPTSQTGKPVIVLSEKLAPASDLPPNVYWLCTQDVAKEQPQFPLNLQKTLFTIRDDATATENPNQNLRRSAHLTPEMCQFQ